MNLCCAMREVRRAPPAPSRERKAQERAKRKRGPCAAGGWGMGEQGRILDLVQDLGLEILPVKTAHNRVQKCSGFPAAAILGRAVRGAPFSLGNGLPSEVRAFAIPDRQQGV